MKKGFSGLIMQIGLTICLDNILNQPSLLSLELSEVMNKLVYLIVLACLEEKGSIGMWVGRGGILRYYIYEGRFLSS